LKIDILLTAAPGTLSPISVIPIIVPTITIIIVIPTTPAEFTATENRRGVTSKREASDCRGSELHSVFFISGLVLDFLFRLTGRAQIDVDSQFYLPLVPVRNFDFTGHLAATHANRRRLTILLPQIIKR